MSRRWRSVLTVTGLVLGPIAIGTLWVQAVAARRWAETLKRTAEIEKELAAPLPDRHPLRGEALPGNAWDDYAAARAARIPLSARDRLLLQEFSVSRSATPEGFRNIVASLEPATDMLRQGSRRSGAHRPPGAALDRYALDGLRARARVVAVGGIPKDVFPLFTDLIRVAQDGVDPLSDSGFVLNYAVAIGAAEDLIRLIGSREAPAPDLKGLAAELLALESTIPPAGRWMLARRIETAREVERGGSFGMAVAFGGLSWRYGYSSKLYFAGALKEIEAWAASLAGMQDRPWSDVIQLQVQALATAERTGNGYLAKVLSSLKNESYGWELRARLRVARAGALFRATGEKIDLDDPFGGKLQWDAHGVGSRGKSDDPRDDIFLYFTR